MTQTLHKLSVDEILPFIGLHKPSKLIETPYGTFKVRMSSPRLECFKKSIICVACGIQGNILLLQRGVRNTPRVLINCRIKDCSWCWGREIRSGNQDSPPPHLNLFHLASNGALTLMTQDHIIPKYHGGGNEQSNLQTMCQSCNSFKGSKLPKSFHYEQKQI